jgi:hypothetical protein
MTVLNQATGTRWQRRACDRAQVILTFDAVALFDHFGGQAFLSPINSGNA